MMRRVPASEWTPQAGVRLEPAALRVASSTASASVVAGPGAGKTELLAQRACFLLQTGTCPPPRHILAISFKRDAARTLRERVAIRAGEHTARFESHTFDAFAKRLLDRFRVCLPAHLRPPAEYSIVAWSKSDVENYLQTLRPPANLGSTYDLVALGGRRFMQDTMVGHRLPESPIAARTVEEWAALDLWAYAIKRGKLSFPMIGRLAELILRVAPMILRALQQTYAFVLLDEFQDTTHIQYDLVYTAFHESGSVLTAVGDHKQRIMGWAMALDDAFSKFEQDFAAPREPLLMNYRSAPELVRIQEFMIKELDPEGQKQQPGEALKEAVGSAEILVLPDHQTEAAFLADEIRNFIRSEGLGPRDICVLTKQKPEVWAKPLLDELAQRGIKARVENELQDLLTEPVTELVLAYLRLAAQSRAPQEWRIGVEFTCAAQTIDPNSRNARRVEDKLSRTIGKLKKELRHYPTNEDGVAKVVQSVLGHLDMAALRQSNPQYRYGTLLDDTIAQVKSYLWESVQREKNWPAALDDFSGRHAVPVMTIHKSKGLEYHTVIFLGLEDSAFWSFKTQAHEDTCAFFVAFSRAKMRVLFTFSRQRTTGPYHQDRPQAATSIRPLYDILRAAGVKTRQIREWPPTTRAVAVVQP